MMLVDERTGEIIEQMTADEAREFVIYIRTQQEELPRRIIDAWRRRAWDALGYESWDAMCGAEQLQLRLPRDERQEIVLELRSAGMSTRAIGSALGASVGTVHSDLQDSRLFNSEQSKQPTTVTSLDGRERPATQPSRMPSTDMPPPIAPEPWSAQELEYRAALEAGETVVVSQRGNHARLIDWAMQRGLYVRVDRATVWGNPFETPADGDRGAVIAHYECHYLPHKPSLQSRLHELRGKALGCWCAPLDCHGDVLKEKADQC